MKRSSFKNIGALLVAAMLSACGSVTNVTPSLQHSAERVPMVPASSSVREQILWSFTNKADGADPIGGVIADADGNLYGGTISAGVYNQGTIFELVPSGNKYNERTLVQFSGPNGDSSVGALTMDRSGTLFGNTVYGGRYDRGTAFSISTKHGVQENVIWSFGGSQSDGAYPDAGMVLDRRGNLYGTVPNGGRFGYGVVYRLTPTASGYSETILHDFGSGDDGRLPDTSLTLGNGGVIYGTTNGGGSGAARGTIFRLTPKGGRYTETVLWNFQGGADGSLPSSPVTFDTQGAIYGVTDYGGNAGCVDGCGTAYKLTPKGSGYAERVIWVFGNNADGYYPLSNVVVGPHGALYGTTWQGGTHYGGVFWRLLRSGKTYAESVLVNFECCNGMGSDPRGNLIADAQHRLYGTTYVGGTSEVGTVYRIEP